MMAGLGWDEHETEKDIEIMDLFSTTYKLIDFGAGELSRTLFLALRMNSSTANTVSRQWAGLIQPVALRSPEVLIGAPWDTKADIWNFGCLVRSSSLPVKPCTNCRLPDYHPDV